MPLNEAKGNMYGFITDTLNIVKGACSHDCPYCYMKRRGRLNPAHIDKKELKCNMGRGHFIFVGSSCDLFAADIPSEWIEATLKKLNETDNRFLVQSKNPVRFLQFTELLPPEKYVLCTTIETNRHYTGFMGKAPDIWERVDAMCRLPPQYKNLKMITVEPIMDFDLKDMVYNILCCNPFQVNIGADSGNNHLPEPDGEKVKALIRVLERDTKVFLKPNLERIMKG
jgi:DNA repair photolyase